MKYKILNETETKRLFIAVYEDNTYMLTELSKENTIEDNLKDLYILTNNPVNRFPCIEEIEGLEEFYKPESKSTFIRDVNFYDLSAKVYDQFGEKMNVDVTFEIEGTGARIEDGEIIEDVVDNDTSYFIVAKYGDLEERQERFLYAPREVEPTEIDILNKKVELLASENEAIEYNCSLKG